MKKSDRTARLAQSDIRAMTLACAKVNGINMSQGVCDTPVPPVVVQGAQQAMAQGHNIYARFDGIAELRQAIAAWARMLATSRREILRPCRTTLWSSARRIRMVTIRPLPPRPVRRLSPLY